MTTTNLVTLVNPTTKKTVEVEVGSKKYDFHIKNGFVPSAPEQGASNASNQTADSSEIADLLAALDSGRSTYEIPAGTNLAQLRAALVKTGRMATGASVPDNATLGECLGATCTKATHAAKSRNKKSDDGKPMVYFRTTFAVTDAGEVEFQANCLANDTHYEVGDSANLEIIPLEKSIARSGMGIQEVPANA